MASDTEIIKVLLQIENPQVFKQLEDLRRKDFTVNLKANVDKGLQQIVGLNEKQIRIIADDSQMLKTLTNIRNDLINLQKLGNIKINLTGNFEEDAKKLEKRIVELQAKAVAPQLTQLGAIQNNNTKTLPSDIGVAKAAVELAGTLKQIQMEAQKQLSSVRASNVNTGRGVLVRDPRNPDKYIVMGGTQQDPIQSTIDDFRRGTNRAQYISSTGAQDSRDLITIAREQRRKEQELFEAQERASEAQRKMAEELRRDQELQRARAISRYNQATAPFSLLSDSPFSSQPREVGGPGRREAIEFFEASKGEQVPLGNVKSFLAEKQRAEAIEAYRQAVGKLPQGKFSPINRGEILKEQRNELFKELGLSLLGGNNPLEAGGRFLGGVAGSAFGPGGTLLGAGIGGAAIQGVEVVAEKLIQVFERLADTGLSFNSSLLGISSILQATTQVRSLDGSPVTLKDQLDFQGGKAKDIQLLARRRLATLGVSGEKESTLVQSIISGAAQKGIDLSPEQVATIAERLGGVIQAQRPELLGNTSQLRRDVEDLLAGLPQRTVLGSLVKSFAPNIGRANTAEDLVDATKGLSSFPTSLRGSSSNPVVAFQKFNAAIDQIATVLGDKFVRVLAPAVDRLATALTNEKFIKALDIAGDAIVSFSENIGKLDDRFKETLGKGGKFFNDSVVTPGQELINKNVSPDVQNGVLRYAGSLVADAIFGPGAGAAFVGADILANGDKSPEKRKLTSQLKASGLQNFILQSAGLPNLTEASSTSVAESPSIVLKLLRSAAEQEQDVFNEDVENLRQSGNLLNLPAFRALDNERYRRSLGRTRLESSTLSKNLDEEQQLFDTSSPLGNLNKLRASLPFLQQISDKAREEERLTSEKKAILPDGFLVSSPAVQTKLEADAVAKAEVANEQAIKKRINALQEERQAVIQVQEATSLRAKTLRDSVIDESTGKGRIQAAQSDAEFARQRSLDAGFSLADLLRQKAQSSNDIDKSNIDSLIERQILNFNKAQIDLSNSVKNEQNRVLDFAQGLQEAAKNLQDFSRATAEAKDKQEALQDAKTVIGQKLSDFDEDKDARKLNSQSRVVSAAERVAELSKRGSGLFSTPSSFSPLFNDLPPEIARLVKGSFGFSDTSRREFERKSAEQDLRIAARDYSRLEQKDLLEKRGIIRDQNKLEREISALPGEESQRRLAALRQAVSNQQQGFNVPGQDEFIKEQSEALGIKIPTGEAAKTIDVNTQEIKNLLAGNITTTLSNILSVLQGKPIEDSKNLPQLSSASGIATSPPIITGGPTPNLPLTNAATSKYSNRPAWAIDPASLGKPLKDHKGELDYVYKADKGKDPYNNDVIKIPKSWEEEVNRYTKLWAGDGLSDGSVLVDPSVNPEPLNPGGTTSVYAKDKNAVISSLDDYFDNFEGGSKGNVTFSSRRQLKGLGSANAEDLFNVINYGQSKKFDPMNEQNRKNLAKISSEIEDQFSAGVTGALKLNYGKDGKISDRKKFLYDNRLFFDPDPEPELTAKAKKLETNVSLPAYPAAFGIAEAPDFDSLFSKNDGTGPLSRSQTYQKIMDRKALERNGAIPNASGMTNPAGRGVYEAITGGLLDSSIVQNVRPASSTVWKGGVNFDTEKQPNQGLDGVINAIKEVGNKISDQVRQGVESSFGGR